MAPNLLFITVDEFRYPTDDLSPELKDWLKKNLRAFEYLKERSAVFTQHRVGSTACAPSRATIHTGQYPSLHGVSQTNGAAKGAFDPDQYWLDQSTVPTWGVYLENFGYNTLYKGKWHITDADIIVPGTKNAVLSYDPQYGIPDEEKTEEYIHGDRLNSYGFHDWVGPEPHGSNSRNSGASAEIGLSGRDVVYANQVIHLLENLSNDRPWAIVASFVNPHDIALYGEASKSLSSFNFDVDPTIPDVPPSPSANEDLSTKPTCQRSYKEVYQLAFQPTQDSQHYRKLYYTLQKKVDNEVNRVLKALEKSKFADNTIVIFTSDHGDFLGAHGLFQKWYAAYEEGIHVPFMVMGPGIEPKSIDLLTSHVDIVPTILGLLGIDQKAALERVSPQYVGLRELVGRDLTPIIYGEPMGDLPQYFMTDDNVTKGLNQVTFTGQQYESVVQPNSIETVIVRLDGKLYKYSKYFNNPQFSGSPLVGAPTLEQITAALHTPRQHEIYDLTLDPYEMNNLYGKGYRSLEKTLRALLREQRKLKRLYPRADVLQTYVPNFPPGS